MVEAPKYISFLKENRTKEQAREIYSQRIKDSEEVYEKFSGQFYMRCCPVCGEAESKAEEKFNGQYGVVKCSRCASMYVNPTPDLDALSYYYNECACNKQLGTVLKTRVGKEGVILSERVESVLSLISSLLEQQSRIRVLEVGCNSGAFLYELREHLVSMGLLDRVELAGIDIDKSAIENPVSSEISLFHSSAEDFLEVSSDSFDLILHFELIEHLHDPFMFCKALKELLCDSGLMYFHTPNVLGLDNQALSYNDFRPLAHGIFPPMHLNAFSTQNIGYLLLRVGFKLRDISTPGNFDVDIVRQFAEDDSPFAALKSIEDESCLAIFQQTLRQVQGSAHLAVLVEK